MCSTCGKGFVTKQQLQNHQVCATHSNSLASEALLIEKFKPNLNYLLGPDKISRVTLSNIFK